MSKAQMKPLPKPEKSAKKRATARGKATPATKPQRKKLPALPAYRGATAEHILWPLGGVGASLVAFTGAGGLDRIALRHHPDLRNAAFSAAALSFPGHPEWARILEGPFPHYKTWANGSPGRGHFQSCGFGHPGGWHHGLPRMDSAEFRAEFPFATVAMADTEMPIQVTCEAWSPFIPGAADDSGLPVVALTYRFSNPSAKRRSAVFSYHVQRDVLRERGAKADTERVRRTAHGFAFDYAAGVNRPSAAGGLSVECDGALADCAWFRGGWFDANTERWNDIQQARARERAPHAEGEPSPGATLWVPLDLPAHGEAEVTVRIAWHEPASTLRWGAGENEETQKKLTEADAANAYRPHYATRFPDADAVAAEFRARYADLSQMSRKFAERLHVVDLPPEALQAVTANLPILRSPTVLRQHDGRMWAWEGTGESGGSCHGSCTHVWNYAQAVAHLFPDLERGLRDTEFGDSQDDKGHQNFRAAIPIRPTDHGFHAAADGQLGGLVKLWRDWQISGDKAWLAATWPRARASLDYCITTWDPDRTGALVEPHHNTYDIEFWGPDGMCGTIYAAALTAAAHIAEFLEENAAPWRDLAAKAVANLDGELFRAGRYRQQVMRATPRSGDAAKQKSAWNVNYSPEALALLDAEGPKYQYADGILSDGVIGAWMAAVAGLPLALSATKVKSHLKQIHRHNLRHDLRRHANPQRATFAMGAEGGLLLCTWPDQDKPSLPFVYSDEVWTGIEYQVASHCILAGLVEEGMDIVRTARARYDGKVRNPFDEFECGHWYARALASWALLPALSGVRYSAVEKTLWIAPTSAQRPYRAWLGRGGDFGTVSLGKTTLEVDLAAGSLAIDAVVVDGKRHAWGVTVTAGAPMTLAFGNR
jgi:hypothetical protein